MISEVLSIFTQVLDGLRSITFDLSDSISVNAYQVLIGIALVTISCKLVFSNVFEKIPHFSSFISSVRPLEVEADIQARRNIRRSDVNVLAWKYQNEIRSGER